MKTRLVYTKFWHDNYISELTAKEKLLFIYLITNEKINLCGIYELPDKYIKFDLGFTQSELNKMKDKFMQNGKFIFLDGWVRIINFSGYNSFTGEKNEIAKQKELSQIPQKIIEYQYLLDRVSSNLDTLNNHNHNNIYINKGVVKGEKTKFLDSVYLTQKQYKNLIDLLGQKKADDMIERLDLYVGSKGDKYKDHYKTILNWLKRDEDKTPQKDNGIAAAKHCYDSFKSTGYMCGTNYSKFSSQCQLCKTERKNW